jgi:hypothetical protein
MNTHFPLLRYLGVVSRPDFSEYGFQIENEDKSVRLLVLTIDNSLFRTKRLMVQEAPDLCYQKLIGNLRSEAPELFEEPLSITETDIARYREVHPLLKASMRRPPKKVN